MNPDLYQDELAKSRSTVKSQWFVIVLLAMSQVICAVLLVQFASSAKTIVTPVLVDRPFWVSTSKVSNEYLEMMAPFVASLVLDISANSAPYKRDMLLKFVKPDLAGDMRIRMEKEALRLSKLNASTVFRIDRVTPDEKTLSVRMDGILTTYINGKPFEADASYIAGFDYNSTGLWLNAFDVPVVEKPTK